MQQPDLMIGKKQFKRQGHTYVMGILNVTPDSFSDGGSYPELSDALYRVEQMMKEGAELIDVGGESTRPGYIQQITDEEEIARTCPVIEAIKKNFDVPVSLDTYKSEVAKAGVQAGMDLFNDIWGLQYDPKMAKIIAQSGLPCVLMHNRKEKMGDEIKATPELEAMFREDFGRILTIAEEAGIDRENILDPGVGFAKSYEQNLWVINHLPLFQEMGYPVLLGTSRKSVVGLTLDLPVNERVEGTLATTAFAVECGCCMVRVHDVRENVRFIRMMEAIRNQK